MNKLDDRSVLDLYHQVPQEVISHTLPSDPEMQRSSAFCPSDAGIKSMDVLHQVERSKRSPISKPLEGPHHPTETAPLKQRPSTTQRDILPP